MKDIAALRPDFFANLPTVIKEKQAQKAGVSDEEMHLYNLSQSQGWKILAEYSNGLLNDLNKGTEAAMQQGLSFEEIGRNAVVIDLAKGVINRILQKVQDAAEACQKSDGTDK